MMTQYLNVYINNYFNIEDDNMLEDYTLARDEKGEPLPIRMQVLYLTGGLENTDNQIEYNITATDRFPFPWNGTDDDPT